MISARTRTVVIGVVTAVWALNFIAGVAVKGYEPSESINGIFMAIVGGLFALGARGGDRDNTPPPQAPPAATPPEITPPTPAPSPPAPTEPGTGTP